MLELWLTHREPFRILIRPVRKISPLSPYSMQVPYSWNSRIRSEKLQFSPQVHMEIIIPSPGYNYRGAYSAKLSKYHHVLADFEK
jgi:hypothetical protein